MVYEYTINVLNYGAFSVSFLPDTLFVKWADYRVSNVLRQVLCGLWIGLQVYGTDRSILEIRGSIDLILKTFFFKKQD